MHKDSHHGGHACGINTQCEQVNCQFKSFGSLQHLKTRFGKDITIQAKVNAGDDTAALKHFMSASFTQLEFKSEHSVCQRALNRL